LSQLPGDHKGPVAHRQHSRRVRERRHRGQARWRPLPRSRPCSRSSPRHPGD